MSEEDVIGELEEREGGGGEENLFLHKAEEGSRIHIFLVFQV